MFSKIKNKLKKNKSSENNQKDYNPLDIEENDHNSRYNTTDEECYLNNYRMVDEFMNKKEIPLFTNIEIETINRCNGTCSFCPVNKNDDTREFKKMSEDLFKDIISQLKEINYTSSIALHSNNEPLLDKRIYKFAKLTRNELQNCYIYLFTNGTLLDIDKFHNLMENLDLIVIDNYTDDFKLHPQVEEIYNYCLENPEIQNKVLIDIRLQNQILTSRGGQANNRNNILKLKTTCLLPYNKIVVQPDGRVPLCCCDPFGKVILGDLNENSLVEIWKGEKFQDIRQKLYQKEHGRENIELCKDCDAITISASGIPYEEEYILNQYNRLKEILLQN